MESLTQLDANLQALRPGEDWGGSERIDGEQGLGLGDGTGVFQDLADLDELAEQLSQSYGGARMDDLDLDKLARQLGDEAAVDARTLRRARAGAARLRLPEARLRRRSCGSPRRRCASSARRCCATSPSGCRAGRATATCASAGAAGERSGRHAASGRSATPSRGTSPRTMHQRRASARGRRRRRPHGVRLDDRRHRGAGDRGPHPGRVALLVDTSFSMAMDGRWVPMKRTALALHTLITVRFRGDAPAADRLRPARRGDGDRAAHRASTRCGTRAPTCTTRCCWPTGTSASTRTPSRCC